jgi:hypothetical protein
MEKDQITLAVGNGNGNLFVHGNYDAIKACQNIIFERDRLIREFPNLLAEVQRLNNVLIQKNMAIQHRRSLEKIDLARIKDLEAELLELKNNNEKLKVYAKCVVSHWNEFGPKSNFEECMYWLEKAISDKSETDKT